MYVEEEKLSFLTTHRMASRSNEPSSYAIVNVGDMIRSYIYDHATNDVNNLPSMVAYMRPFLDKLHMGLASDSQSWSQKACDGSN